METAPGWYGKLPSLGDFASRRLPADFIDRWDDWLSLGLAGWRDGDDGWLAAYLAGPAWCFFLGAGALGEPRGSAAAAWAGVLMPSVDSVGRYFPLTLAVPLPPGPVADPARLVHWLQHAAALAVDALHEDWSAEQFELALQGLAELTLPTGATGAAREALGDVLSGPETRGTAAWWWLPVAGPDLFLQRSVGLPTGAAFSRLLSGHSIHP